MIDIKGFMKTSMLDYPGKIASVIFLSRCTFHCPYCHNKELVVNDPRLIPFEEDYVLDYLKKKKDWIDGVVISGGEPTMHKGVPELCKKIKNMGFDIKLDTNGTNPVMLKELIDNKLVDYVAMDVKSSKENYEKATAVKVNMENIEKSVKILIDSDIDYEFRTTVLPGIVSVDDIKSISLWIKGAKAFYIQQFVPIKTLNESYMKKQPYLNSVLYQMRDAAKDNVMLCEVRGV